MKLGSAIMYFGGKNRLASKYPAPKHDIIVEPFAGGAGYSLLHHERQVILVEKYWPLAEMWRFLVERGPEAVARIPLDLTPATLRYQPLGVQVLVGYRWAAGQTRPAKEPTGWAKSGERPNSYWGSEKMRDRLVRISEAIQHWWIVEGDFCHHSPDIKATWFVDPPYQKAGVAYPCSSKDLDFKMLARWCAERRGQTIVCEAEGADWLPFVPLCPALTTVGRKKRRYQEMVWLQTTD